MENIQKLKEWYLLSRYREFVETHDKEAAWEEIQHRIRHRRRIRLWRTWGGVAAMFVAIAGATLWYADTNGIPDGLIAGTDTTATVVNDSTILSRTCQNLVTDTMPDGTSVVMNAGTVLHYGDMSGASREVEMTGEAYFAVVRNEQHPFIVTTPAGRIEVLGTHFNVVADQESTIVTLEEGSVRLHFSDRQFTMKPGEQARMYADGTFDVRHVNATNYTSWSTGTYEFTNASLDEIVRQLSLWYGVTITIADKSLEDTRYTGVILRSEPLENAISILRLISDLQIQIHGKEIIIR